MTRTTRTRKIALAAGLVLGSLVPTQAALAWSPPAPNGDLPIAIPEPSDPEPGPQGPDDKVGPAVDPGLPGPDDFQAGGDGPDDPCEVLVCIDPNFQAGGDGPDDPGVDPTDDTVSGRPDFTG